MLPQYYLVRHPHEIYFDQRPEWIPGSIPADPAVWTFYGKAAARCLAMDLQIEFPVCQLVPIEGSFQCPISLEYMENPVVTADGQVYENEFIRRHFRTRRRSGRPVTSPCTNVQLPSEALLPLPLLKRVIEIYLTESPSMQGIFAALQRFQEERDSLSSELSEHQGLLQQLLVEMDAISYQDAMHRDELVAKSLQLHAAQDEIATLKQRLQAGERRPKVIQEERPVPRTHPRKWPKAPPPTPPFATSPSTTTCPSPPPSFPPLKK